MKTFISKNLYKEALKRTKTLMIALLIVAVCITSIIFFNNVSGYKWSYESTNGMPANIYGYNSCSDISGILSLYVYVMGFGLAMSAFSFLNKRNASDFYHGVPFSRLSLFFSNMAACATQILIMIMIVIAIPAVGSKIVGLSFCYRFLPRVILTCFVGTMLVCSATALAMSITGTAFSNIILVGLMLFLPRFITTLAGEIITAKTAIVPISALGVFFNPIYNIAVAIILCFFSMENIENVFTTSSGTLIYSAVLVVIYLVLGALAFIKRKSETAGNAAPGKILQCVYRCAVALVFAIAFVTGLQEDSHMSTEFLLTLAAASLISFVLFELITTRSMKSVLKSLPTYGFVIAAAAVFALVVSVSSNLVLNVKVEAEKVKSIQVLTCDGNCDSTYEDLCMSNAKITSNDAIQCASRELNNTIKMIKSGKKYYTSNDAYPRTRIIKFNLKNGTSVERYVIFDPKTEFESLIYDDSAYIAASKKLPENKDIVYAESSGLNRDESMQLWKTLRSEISQQSTSLSSIDDNQYTDDAEADNSIASVTILGLYGYKTFTDTYVISFDSTPKTADYYFKLVQSKSSANIDTLVQCLDSVLNQGTDSNINDISIDIFFMDKNYAVKRADILGLKDPDGEFELNDFLRNSCFSLYLSGSDYELYEQYKGIPNILKNAKPSESLTNRTIHISGYISKYIDEYEISDSYINYYVDLTESDFDALLRLCQSYI